MRVNTVYLQAFSTQTGTANADAMYFPNRHLPVRSDLVQPGRLAIAYPDPGKSLRMDAGAGFCGQTPGHLVCA